MSKGNRDLEKEKFWRSTIADQQKSAQSQAEYCRLHGLNENSFSWWKRELPAREQQDRRERAQARKLAKQQAAAPVPVEAPSFVPLVLAGTENGSSEENGLLEIRFPGAAVLVHPGADVKAIRSVILAFRECWF
jgi:hypothetical protein